MKKLILLFFIAFQMNGNAQVKLEDFGRVLLNTYLHDNNSIPAEAKNALETKLSQITTNNDMGGSISNPRFIITAVLNVTTNDIIPGPPQMIAQNIEVTLFVGDAITNTVFSNTVISIKGVGTNENKALVDAIKNINPKNKDITAFLEEGKNKIISHYTSQCDFIIKDSESLAKQEKFDEAIYKLALVPEACKECYFKTSELIGNLFQQKIDNDCKAILSKAKLLWSGQQNIKQAEEVIAEISDINPNASCYVAADNFIKEINFKIKADEKVRMKLALKKYNDKMELGKQQINAYKEIATEYAKNKPRTITYTNIIWR